MRRIKSSVEERMKALQENRYLSGLHFQILDYLAQHTQLISFESEECILREGEPGQGLYIVQSGRVKIFKHSPTGREMIISVLESGDTFMRCRFLINRRIRPMSVLLWRQKPG